MSAKKNANEKKKGEGITVVGVDVENFHRIRFARVEALPGTGLVRITGRNGAGKTSLLRSLRAALGGKGEILPEAVVNEASEDGKGRITLSLSNGFTVERRFTPANPKGYLDVVGPDGAKHKQGKLDEWLGPLAFDPLAFFELRSERQVEILFSLCDPSLPLELSVLRDRAAAIADERTPWIVEKRRLLKIEEPTTPRPEPIDLEEELERQDELQAEVDEFDRLARNSERARRELALAKEWERDALAKVERAREALRGAEEALEEAGEEVGLRQAALVDAEKEREVFPDPRADLEEVRNRIRAAGKVAEALRPWEEWDRREEALEEARRRETELTRALKDLEKEEEILLADADLPVEGLSFDAEKGALLNGLPLSVASGAERIRFAVAVALAARPDLRVALVDEANDVDLEGLAALDELAKEHGFQIWVCRIGLEGPGEIVVEEGEARAGGEA